MNAFHLKVIAITTMIIDHLGLYFFPESFAFRIIGRLSFPLFAWLIANGAYHSKNTQKYFYRLLLFAFISQVPYLLTNRLMDPTSTTLNIFFTLSLGLGAILLIRKTTMKIHWVLISAISATLGFVLHVDYGGLGVVSIIAFYIFFKNKKALVISQSILFALMSLYFLSLGNSLGLIQLLGLLSLIGILSYSGKEGPKFKYIFYFIYPLHYLLIYFVLSQV